MKKLLFAALVLASGNLFAQHNLTKVWETSADIAVPESVLYGNNGTVYISLIDGAPWEDDKKGGIATMTADGKNVNQNWVTGLSAPKGMAISKGKLYVADLNRVAVIDIRTAKIIKTIAVPGSENLNDVTAGRGNVYVSDSKKGNIWEIKNDQPSLYLDNTPGVNGLFHTGNFLYYGEGKKLMRADVKKTRTQLATVTEGIDGIEQLANGDFVLSSWIGYVYYVDKNGNMETLLQTHEQKINAADIGLDKAKNIVYVPTFFGKTVAAYQLN